jgi:hypothetical protein
MVKPLSLIPISARTYSNHLWKLLLFWFFMRISHEEYYGLAVESEFDHFQFENKM